MRSTVAVRGGRAPLPLGVMSTSAPVRTERTNFQGDWSDICPHCGKAHGDHRITHGPFDGVVYEHRMPCEPERQKMIRERRQMVTTAKIVILTGWILVPFVYLLLQQFVAMVGWIAFGIGVLQLCVVTIKHFGNPDRWIPGYKRKKERELQEAHWIYHCERNPHGFARLRAENFEREEREEEKSAQSDAPNEGPATSVGNLDAIGRGRHR